VNRIIRSPLLHAGGWGGPGQPLATCRQRMAKLTHNQTHAQIEQRKLNSPILLARISIARANQRRQHLVARARGVSVDLHRPLKEAHNTRVMGPPYDSAIIKYFRFDCDTTKGTLWRFGEAAHLLISQRSAKARRGRRN
jgi:hypothetical protein